jgi:predicted permease
MSWKRFFRRGQNDAELQQEVELHLEEEVAENVARGMDAGEAQRRARVKFGSVQRMREEVWEQGSISVAEDFMRDLGHVFRRLVKSPAAVVTVVVSLGLGIAANVFIFTAVNKLMFQGPPVGNPTTLLDVYSTFNHGQRINKSTLTMYDDLREQTKSFSGVAAYDQILPATIGGQGEAERVWGQSTTANFFDVAELPMALGRGFFSGEDRTPVVVLSYELWRRHFNGDAVIVGKTVPLSGRMFTVIGVTARGFHGINRFFEAEFWVPMGEREQLAGESLDAMEARQTGSSGGWLDVIARLKPGVSRSQATAELNAMAGRLAIAHPKEDEGLGFHTEQSGGLLPSQRDHFAIFLTALAVIAFLVLCIASSNVANLLLVRAAARHKEMAVRIALGATRFQLIRPLLLESTLLAVGGGVFGVALSLMGIQGLTVFHLPSAIPIDLSLNVDWRVAVYAFLLSVGTGMLCGVGPALTASRPVLPNSLKGESTLDRPGRRWGLRNLLVVLQISLCAVLLCTTGLFLRSLGKSAAVDPGFRTSGVVMMSIDPGHNGYSPEQTSLLLKRLRERAITLPGVKSAVWTDKVPLSFYGQGGQFHKAASAANPKQDPRVEVYEVNAGYFNTLGVPWVAGRDFDTVDPNAPKQAVVNEEFARMVFGRSSAVGQWVTDENATYEIVGVVKNTKSMTVSEDDEPILYSVLEQNMGMAAPIMGFSLLMRYEGNPAEVSAAMQNEIHGQDPTLAVFGEKRMDEQLSDALIMPRVAAVVFGVFGFSGLLLAAVGLYSVMSYSVSSRTREIGIRLALGATRSGVRGLVVRQGMVLSCVALGIGLPLALAASKIAGRALYGIAPHDWMTFTAVPVFLAAVALLACWLPARRAATVDPQTALRHE